MGDVGLFTLEGVRRGLRPGAALAVGVFAYGLAFGLVADQAQLTTLQAVLISALVYSGSAQLAVIGVMSAGISTISATAWAVVALILVMNARYILFGATLRPWLGPVSAIKAYPSLYILGDGSWMMSLRAYDQGERDAGFILGLSLWSFVAWLSGTAIGSIAGGLAPNPKVLGLDFMLVAFSAAMMVGMFRGKRDFAVLAFATGVAILVAQLGHAGWAPILAGLAGGAVAFFRAGQAE
jgi:predicted branched-subunit amino acid permease